MAGQVITPETQDTEVAAVRFAIDSSGPAMSCWRTLDARMDEDTARFAFGVAGKPSDGNPGEWTHKLVRLLVNRYGEELQRTEIARKIEA